MGSIVRGLPRFFASVAGALVALVIASRADAGGPLMLSGHDPDDHGFVAQYVPLFNAIRSNVTNGGTGILAIGADVGTSAGNWISSVAAGMTPPQTVTFVNDAAISTVSFSGYAILHIPSTTVDTPGGIGTSGSPSENARLITRATAIAAFINGGGGLFGLTQDQVANAYAYLGAFANVTAVGVPASGDCDGGGGSATYDNVTATALGTTLGITNTNIDGCCWHNTFSTFAPFFNTLATANEPLCTTPVINGQASVIGCLQCNIPGQMNLTPGVDFNPPGTNHTLTATFLQGQAPNSPIVGAVITFTVISGPNAGATGNATTNGSGQASFTYTGTGGIGLDTIHASGVDPFTSQTITSSNALKFWDVNCNNNAIPDTCDMDCSAYGGACLANYGACGADGDLNGNDIPDSCDDCVTNADCSNGQFCDGVEICNVDVCQPGSPPNCNDSISCTADSCNEGTNQCDHGPSNALCDNGQFCDGVEVCDLTNGCIDGPNPNCNDSVSCTADSCNEGTNQCDHGPSNALCDNGQFCDGVEVCDLTNGCIDGPNPNCNDSVSCTADSCNEGTNQCDHGPSNALCDNGQFCDGVEVCDLTNGCIDGPNPNCNDSVSCTADSCNEGTDHCDHGPSNAACDNGQFCDGVEVCDVVNGCQAGPPVICSDGHSCTLDTCNEGADQCDHVANNGACNDFVFCNGVETCSLANGCEAGTPVNCNDGVSCTVDSCDEMIDDCAHAPNHAVCSNGQFCDGGEVCNPVNGCEPGPAVDCGDGVACTVDSCNEGSDQCDHAPNNATCSNGQFCDGAEVCHPTNDCQPGTPPNCNDSVSCTADSCNEGTDHCDHGPSNAACDNGQFCDGVEVCDVVNGCIDGPNPNCNDGVSCTGDSCNEGTDQCNHVPNNAACVNGQFCDGTETCDPVDDCQPGTDPCDPMACSEVLDQCVACLNNAHCNDGQYCNGVETCNVPSGTCIPGTPVVCNDGIACTEDACNEATDACVAPPNNGLCSDSLFCNGAETCNPGSGCQAGAPVVCNDGVACTTDACNEALDQCSVTPNHAVCSNGQFCDGNEVCNPITGCGAGTPVNCGDGVSCTTDACNEALDQCTFTPVNASCSNGLYCDGTEICHPTNNCVAGPAVNCNDGVACTTDVCSEFSDVCQSTPNHGACSDGIYCDGGEICDPILGCQAGTIVDCNDSNACTIDTCDESQDMCVAEDICCGNASVDIGEECDDGNLVDADGCDSNCTYTGCGNGIVTPGEQCEYSEICGNLVDDDEDGFFDCADPDCQAQSCTANCQLAPPCSCIEEDPAIIMLTKSPNFFRLHGRIPGDPAMLDPQAEGVLLQLSNDVGVIYEAELPPDSFVTHSPKRFSFRDKTAVTGVDPVGPHAGLAQLVMGFRTFDGVSYLTFKLKAFGDFSAATLSCMTTQLTIGDDLGALRADWTLRNSGAWWLRPGDYSCPDVGCASDVP